MASVLGHSMCGIISGNLFQMSLEPRRKRWLVALCVLIAFLPDLDVIVYMVLRPTGMTPHRGFSHSLAFAFLVTAVTFLLTYRSFPVPKSRLLLSYGSSAVSAPLLDYFMGAGPKIPFFAPFWDEGFLFPLRVIPTAYYSTKLDSLISILWYPPAVRGFALEILIFLPLVFLLTTARGARPQLRLLLLLIALGGLLATIVIYN